MFELRLSGLILLTILSQVCGQGWSDPYFRDPITEGVTFSGFSGSQRVEMEEELPLPIKLAIINYNGPGTPTIESFSFGSSQYLNLRVARLSNEWTIFIENRQDFENPSQRRYEFAVTIGNDSDVTEDVRILILVTNIFDNAPAIIYDGPCQADELRANFDTQCKFQVYDADGMVNNRIRLEIEGSYDESSKFEFRNEVERDAYTEEYTLFVIDELRYEDRALYNFKTHVFDVANNTGFVTTIVEITDLPSLDPIWVTPFATARFDEKTTQNFQVKAIDGDTGINLPIHYKLGFLPDQDYSEYISINGTSGAIAISAIDRDALKKEVFPFNVIAFKENNESWAITGEAVLIVDDVNDNYPEIDVVPSEIYILENTYLTLDLERFIVDDIDLGIHATYDVSLLSQSGSTIDYAVPFNVIPTKGYQESSFTISVTNTTDLDYEDPDWQRFQIIIRSQEEDLSEHFREFEFTVNLINWNDEFPIFNQSEYYIDINETCPINEILTTITATDRDVNDTVIHTIVGISDLSISADGVISTIISDTFDYERQTQVLVQIQATDTLQTLEVDKLNSAFAQLIINVIDVNDETPQIRMPRQSPSIIENSAGGTLVNSIVDGVVDGILATDPDKSANLEFRIDWDLSYATKSGQEAAQEFYENCFIIEPNKTDPNRVIGYLMVNPDFPIDIDYEQFEVIYLTILVTDLNQEVNEGTAEAVLTVRIEDENDNRPEFILDTLETQRSVVEEASAGTLLGTIFAQDIDGPEFNNIIYSIRPSETTPPDLVEINAINGAITVRDDAIIDCDEPKIDDLIYIISLTDGLPNGWTTEGEIKIHIIDINNKVPHFEEFETVIEMYENATTADEIALIKTIDIDRDPPHNTVQHMINYGQFPNLGRYFAIDELTGQLEVKLMDGYKLDRDHGEDVHEIHINILDNFQGSGRTNPNTTMIKLILLDVNDNPPQMPEFQPTISEFVDVGSKIGPTFYAPDIDDPKTPNALVKYRIVSIEPGRNNADVLPDASEIFEVRNYDDMYCDVIVNAPLKGFYGTWNVTIEAFDHGHEWTSQIQMKSQRTYEITVDPYNFNAPELVYPLTGKTHRLSYESQQVGRPLMLADNTTVPMFEAIDNDGGIYGDITFELANYAGEVNDDMTYFRIVKENRKQSQIYLERRAEARFYQLNVRAVDGGLRSSEWATAILFIFIDLTGDPVFDMPIFDTDFTENSDGLIERRIIPEAIDPKNIGIEIESEKFSIYYFIDAQYRPDDARLFELDSVTRELKLASELDREAIDNHQIRVIATNNPNGPQDGKESSMLIVNISVNDVNDNPPRFEFRNYGAGITPTDWLGKEIITVTAYDPDLEDEIRYVFDAEGIKADGENLNDVLSTAFNLSTSTGILSLNFAVLSTMKGFFEFKIVAYDLVNHQDQCDVKIFIIADSARVTFVLLNEKSSVDHLRSYVAQTFTDHYGFECYIDDVQKAVINGAASETVTNVRAHFIQNNEAIEANLILAKSSDIVFITNLKSALLKESINLLDVPNSGLADIVSNLEHIIQIILIVISVILAALSCSLIVAYCIKTRSLNRQLKALSATDFGSTESNLNRREAPTTNVFSVEGSNPVLNNNDLDKGMFDNMSVDSESSDDSDFVGIDKDPTFAAQNGKRESTNVAVLNGINGKMGHINGIKEDFDNYMIESKKSSKNSDFGFSKF